METVAMPLADELAEVSQKDYAAPPKFEEQDLDILAFELWQRANCPKEPADEYWLGEEEALRCHASCL
jgi:hypothetical protein